MSRKSNNQVIGPCIKRAVTEVQARTKKWWARHTDADQTLAIVDKISQDDPNFILCGILRETDPKTGKTEEGILYTPKKSKVRKWRLAIPNDIQIDTDAGVAWETVYSLWDVIEERYGLIQAALIATSGMPDDELAALLKVPATTIKKWYTGKADMPLKVIKEITKKFIK